jgi:hypothetical protein
MEQKTPDITPAETIAVPVVKTWDKKLDGEKQAQLASTDMLPSF